MSTDELRVRVYELVEDGHWNDRGTGFLYVKQPERRIVVLCEENEEEALLSHIVDEAIEYELQGNTIISWVEPETDTSEAMDLALSFQEEDACAATWEWISQVCPEIDVFDDSIPDPTPNNLDSIIARLASPISVDWHLKVDQPSFIPWFDKLYTILTECEKAEDFERCEQVHGVLHELVKYGNKHIMDSLVSTELYQNVLHMAEYHPHRTQKVGIPHDLRTCFRKSSRLTLPGICMPSTVATAARRLFSLIFLRDVVLLVLLEESSVAHLDFQIYHQNHKVVSAVASDVQFFEDIRTKIKQLVTTEGSVAYDELILVISFLHELILKRCKLLKLLQRRDMILRFVGKGLLEILSCCVHCPSATPKSKPLLWRLVVETVHQTLSGMGISEMKKHIIAEEENTQLKQTFLKRLLDCLHQPCESGLLCQIVYLIRFILLFPDAQTPEAALYLQHTPASEVSDIWRMFHKCHFESLLTLLEGPPHTNLSTSQLRNVQIHIVGILKSMVDKHDFTMKHTVLKNSLMQKVATLIQVPDTPNQPIPNLHLTMTCLRFFRACINQNDDFYNKRLAHKNVLDTSVGMYAYNGDQPNLLNSCFLSILAPILTSEAPMKHLVLHVGKRYLPKLEKINVALWRPLREKYEQLLNKEESTDNTSEPAFELEENSTLPSDDDKEAEEAPVLKPLSKKVFQPRPVHNSPSPQFSTRKTFGKTDINISLKRKRPNDSPPSAVPKKIKTS